MDTEKTTAETDLDFEQAIKELEKIVKNLENGQIRLDESLALYEKGIKYVAYCNKLLDEAESKVKILSRDENGEVVEKDFEAK